MKPKPTRITIPLTPELKEWYDSSADSMGLTTTAFIIMCLTEMKKMTIAAQEMYEQNKTLLP